MDDIIIIVFFCWWISLQLVSNRVAYAKLHKPTKYSIISCICCGLEIYLLFYFMFR